jgi:hypothetical protein
MKIGNRVLISFICLLPVCLLLVVGCKPQTRQSKIEITVFITTRNGESIKLGNVPVAFFGEDDFRSNVRTINGFVSRSVERSKTKIEADIEGLRTVRATPYGTAMAEYSQLKGWLRQDVAECYDLRFAINRQLMKDSIEKGYADYTDAEGIASLTLPDKKGAYYVLAATERQVGSTTEKYYWLERVNPSTTTKIIFSNNNLWNPDTQAAAFGIQLPPALPDYPELKW